MVSKLTVFLQCFQSGNVWMNSGKLWSKLLKPLYCDLKKLLEMIVLQSLDIASLSFPDF